MAALYTPPPPAAEWAAVTGKGRGAPCGSSLQPLITPSIYLSIMVKGGMAWEWEWGWLPQQNLLWQGGISPPQGLSVPCSAPLPTSHFPHLFIYLFIILLLFVLLCHFVVTTLLIVTSDCPAAASSWAPSFFPSS